jgi:predicted ribosomally synthesized peptide with nif11-like leader
MKGKGFDDLIAAGETDRELAKALNAARTTGEVVALGAGRGFSFSEEDVRAGLVARRGSRPLADSEVEGVAGGRKAGKEQQDYYKITMQDVLISGF